jgi:hypothetical protein
MAEGRSGSRSSDQAGTRLKASRSLSFPAVGATATTATAKDAPDVRRETVAGPGPVPPVRQPVVVRAPAVTTDLTDLTDLNDPVEPTAPDDPERPNAPVPAVARKPVDLSVTATAPGGRSAAVPKGPSDAIGRGGRNR